VRRWANETRQDAHPLLLFILNCTGLPEGNRPIDLASVLNPMDMVSLEALETQLNRLVEEVGLGEDFLVTALVRAVAEHLERLVAEREQSLAAFRQLSERLAELAHDPEQAARFLAERGLAPRDVPAVLEQVRDEAARLQDPGWVEARRRDAEVWRRATAPLLDPGRRAAWEQERFRQAGEALGAFFRGPEGLQRP